MSLTSPAMPGVISSGFDVDSREEIDDMLSLAEPEGPGATSRIPEAVPAYSLDPTNDHGLFPIAVTIDFLNTSCSQYDRLLEKMGLSPRGSGLPGCLFHWARSMPDGLRIMEVWRNRDLFEFHHAETVLPVIADLRLPEPDITFYDVHNYLTGESSQLRSPQE